LNGASMREIKSATMVQRVMTTESMAQGPDRKNW
jgi:hypothetical protein